MEEEGLTFWVPLLLAIGATRGGPVLKGGDGLRHGIPQISASQTLTGNGPPEVLLECRFWFSSLGQAQDSAYPMSSRMLLMLLVHRPHFE